MSFRNAVFGIVLFYVAVSAIYAVRLPRNMDEFGTAHAVYDAVRLVPYRDYCPPKTLIAYYVFAPPLLFVGDAWNAITAAKFELVLLTAVLLMIAAFVLRRVASERAVLASLALFVLMTTFLERSMELRNDPVASLFGLASLLCLISGRPLLAGAFCALSFLSTQKGIYFVAAAEVALGAVWLRDRSMRAFRALLALNAGGALTGAAYVALWAIVASPEEILRCTFANEASLSVALTPIYDIRAQYWMQTLLRNPFFYALAAVSLVLLAREWLRRSSDAVAVVTPYAFVIVAASVWHKQPWPYFFVILVPTLFVVNTLGLDVVLQRLRDARLFVIAGVAFGILFPLARLANSIRRDNSHQKATFHLAEALLAPGESYADGLGMLYRHRQADGLPGWIDKSVYEWLRTLKPDEAGKMIEEMDRNPPKLMLWNYRMAALPKPFMQPVLRRFAPLYGNIFYYAPVVDRSPFTIAFDGSYALDSPTAVAIDGRRVAPRGIVELRKGAHSIAASSPVRLRLLPPAGIEADPDFERPRDLFGGIDYQRTRW